MKISLVVAVAEDHAIGKNGTLLWRLPNDMTYFKRITTGHHVLMGRVTYESIPPKFRPLEQRVNLVVSRNSSLQLDGCVVVHSVEDALKYAREQGEEELMVIGGEQIYKACLPMANRIYYTRVQSCFPDADAHFPALEAHDWTLTFEEKHPADERHMFPYSFCIYERVHK